MNDERENFEKGIARRFLLAIDDEVVVVPVQVVVVVRVVTARRGVLMHSW